MKKDNISAGFPFESKYIDILGSKIHYVEQGHGDPILFLHGIPASSYVWRNIIPHLSSLGRCIAPDLIGMGKSSKPDIQYTISDHIHYIESFIEAMNLKRVTLVMHGWGSIVGLDYAMRNEKNCKALAFYEAYLRPSQEGDISLPLQEQLTELENADIFDTLMSGASFVDQVLPQSVMRVLSSEEIDNYKQPYIEKNSGKPFSQYLQEVPRGDGSSKVDKIIANYSAKLKASYLPKLLLYSIPGFITTIATIMWAKEFLNNLELAEIGEDLHFAQETNPFVMGETISVWLQSVEQIV